MKHLKHRLDRNLNYIKANKYKILGIYLVLFVSFLILFLFDQLTKTLLFEHGSVINDDKVWINDRLYVVTHDGSFVWAESIWPNDPNQWPVYGFLGIRSIWHGGVTLVKTRNQFLIQGLSVVFCTVVLISPLIWRNLGYGGGIILGNILAGVAGNMIDRFIFQTHVKDVFYFTFSANSGTFNIADVEIMMGIISFAIYTFFSSRKKTYSNIQHLVA